MAANDKAAVRLLTRHFVRRLIDNDLISPHADRHESLAVLIAVVVSLAVFVTFFISTTYLASYIQLPGPTALFALPDRFLFIAGSLTISALATLLVWEALALEPRDGAILGPLPLSPRTITRAKLAAVLLFGAAFAIALNAVPSILYPTFLTLNLRGVGGWGLLRLIAGQAMTAIMAALFAFFVILALRGVLCLVAGDRRFRRISSLVQGVLVVFCVTCLLLAPTVRGIAVRDWVSNEVRPRWPVAPVLWYLGVNETVAGYVLSDAPAVLPPRLTLVPVLQRQDDDGRSAYGALRPRFAALARIAWLTFPPAAVLAIGSFLWNSRRLPDVASQRPAQSRARLLVHSAAERLTRADPEAQAGFFFALQTLMRSGPHRMTLAVSIAVSLTLPILALVRNGAQAHLDLASAPLGLIGIQIMVLSSLIAGLRHAVTVPAELAANWTIQLAWLGDERRYLAGVKRAGIVMLVAAPLLALLPLHVALFGTAAALVHALYGLLFAVALLDAMFLGYRKLPFACSYVPIEDPKLLWPLSLAAFFVVTYGFASVERFMWRTPTSAIGLCALLAAIVFIVRLIDRAQRREGQAVDFNERPAMPTQRLGLSATMTGSQD